MRTDPVIERGAGVISRYRKAMPCIPINLSSSPLYLLSESSNTLPVSKLQVCAGQVAVPSWGNN